MTASPDQQPGPGPSDPAAGPDDPTGHGQAPGAPVASGAAEAAEAPSAAGVPEGAQAPEAPGAAGGDDRPGRAGLSGQDLAVLAMERRGWPSPGLKERAIREQLGITPTRYYQLLNALLDDPAALEHDPVTVNRLRRVRAARRVRR